MVELQGRRSAGRHRRVVPLSTVPAQRLWLVFAVLAAGLVGLAVRLAWVQVVQGPDLQRRARAVQTQTITPIGKRRTIVDRQGRLVALDEERFMLWAHPATSPSPATTQANSALRSTWPAG